TAQSGKQGEGMGGHVENTHMGSPRGTGLPASAAVYNGDLENTLRDAQHLSGQSGSEGSHVRNLLPREFLLKEHRELSG
uniref:Uncharacterized protein n=1 Tax=Marmota marmota marmota TaxID=9994 RepID=A0A8C6EMJ8_MARMA